MSGYELSRRFYDWCFENPEKISPNHSAIYFFAIEQCNRLGWKSKFGFPTQMAMDAIGIRKHETYIRYFNDLVEWGFFVLVQKSLNQYSANIISLESAIPKNGEALGKAILTHAGKQTQPMGESNGESNRSINKQQTNKQLNLKPKTITTATPELNIPFTIFWNLYDKGRGKKEKIEILWAKLTNEERVLAIEHIPKYKASQPDKQFRKDPATYLNNKSFNDEIIINNGHSNGGYQQKGATIKQAGMAAYANEFYTGF